MKKNKLIYSLALIAFTFLAWPAFASFDPDYIISDEEMMDSSTMGLSDIQEFLKNKNSYLAGYTCPNAYGNNYSAAQIIYDAAVNNYDCDGIELSDNPTLAEKKQKCQAVSINPRLLLVLLQKEQSLIEESAPTQRQLDWATGYGCFDGQACNLRWQGFGKQVNSASLQFYDYLISPQKYPYQPGKTYTISNTNKPSSIVTPANAATAALYNYTPHVYNGNYNFYQIWSRYFTRTYPNNTLLQAYGEPGVWLIKNGEKRPFLTKGALTTRFDLTKIIQVNKSDLDNYPKGAPIKFPQYSLVRSPDGAIYLLVDNKKLKIASPETFKQIGYNPEEVLTASWEDVNAYDNGQMITASSTYVTGALLQNKKTGGVYYVIEGTKAPLWDSVLLKTKFRKLAVIQVEPEKLDGYKTIDPILYDDGELVKTEASSAVYILDNGRKRPVISGEIFEALGYDWKNIITISPKILALYELGEPLDKAYSRDSIE